MPLLDHFHPPLSVARHWEAFHSRWASAISDALNEKALPSGYSAEPQTHAGSPVEVDVATFEEDASLYAAARPADGGGTATLSAPAAAPAYRPPAPVLSIPAIFPDSLEVRVFSDEAGPVLIAAVELVGPGNKDRAEYRRGFAAKCASYLQQGVGLMVVDIVTNRHGNLHNELVDLLQAGPDVLLPAIDLYAVSYHPVHGRAKGPGGAAGSVGRLDLWHAPLGVGQPLPLLPLPLDKDQFVPLDLEAAYVEARHRIRLG